MAIKSAKNFFLTVSIILLTAITASGCSDSSAEGAVGKQVGNSNAEDSEFISGAEVPADLERAIERFPGELPEGVTWSMEPLLPPGSEDAVVEEGFSDVAVTEYWLCAWMDQYIQAEDASNDQLKNAAMAEIETYTSMPAIVAHHTNPDDFTSSVIGPAKLGDSTILRAFFNNCTNYERANPRA